MTDIQYFRIIVVEYIICFFAGIGVFLGVVLYEIKDIEHDEKVVPRVS